MVTIILELFVIIVTEVQVGSHVNSDVVVLTLGLVCLLSRCLILAVSEHVCSKVVQSISYFFCRRIYLVGNIIVHNIALSHFLRGLVSDVVDHSRQAATNRLRRGRLSLVQGTEHFVVYVWDHFFRHTLRQ